VTKLYKLHHLLQLEASSSKLRDTLPSEGLIESLTEPLMYKHQDHYFYFDGDGDVDNDDDDDDGSDDDDDDNGSIVEENSNLL